MIKKILPIILISILGAYYAQAGQYDGKIAIIDVHAILDKSLAVQVVKKDIEKISECLKQDMNKKEQELQKAEQEIKEKYDALSEEALNLEIKKFNKKISETQRFMQEKKNRLDLAHAEAINKIHEATQKIVQEIAQEKGFNVAIPSAHIFYTDPSLDITNEVISKLNERLKSVHVNYK